MKRISISLPENIADELDELLKNGGYSNRSEAVRDLIRKERAHVAITGSDPDQQAVAVVSYVYNHHQRQLASRMTQHQHNHCSIVVSLMHVHINAEDCLETVVLRGKISEVLLFAKSVISEPFVRNGEVNCIPAAAHEHDDKAVSAR